MAYLAELVAWHATYCLAIDLLIQAVEGMFQMPHVKLEYRVKGYAAWVLLVVLRNA